MQKNINKTVKQLRRVKFTMIQPKPITNEFGGGKCPTFEVKIEKNFLNKRRNVANILKKEYLNPKSFYGNYQKPLKVRFFKNKKIKAFKKIFKLTNKNKSRSKNVKEQYRIFLLISKLTKNKLKKNVKRLKNIQTRTFPRLFRKPFSILTPHEKRLFGNTYRLRDFKNKKKNIYIQYVKKEVKKFQKIKKTYFKTQCL